jgi:hypothetical protein
MACSERAGGEVQQAPASPALPSTPPSVEHADAHRRCHCMSDDITHVSPSGVVPSVPPNMTICPRTESNAIAW